MKLAETRFCVPPLSQLDQAQEASVELVVRARQGDHAAFEELYRRYSPAVIRRLTHLLGPAGPVNDLLQETFLHAFQQLSRLKTECCFGHWVLRIAGNLARSSFRRERRAVFRLWERPEDEKTVVAGDVSAEDTYPTLRAVHLALAELSPPLREAVVLFELEGLSLGEMALQLGIPLHTAASRVRRGRERLRSALKRMGLAPILEAAAGLCGEEQR